MERERNGVVQYPIKVDTKTLGPKVNTFLKQAEAFVIEDEGQYLAAAEALQRVKGLKKDVDEVFSPTKKALDLAKSEFSRLVRSFTDVLDRAEEIIKGKMGPWRAKQKAAQDAERARIEAERRKQAEKEQKALAKKTGDKTLLDLPVVVPKVVVEDATKVSGISYQSVPKFEVVNPELVPDEYWVIDEVKIGKAVRAASGNITIPGVRVWMEEVVKSAAYQSRR